jgi:hypothetical protein
MQANEQETAIRGLVHVFILLCAGAFEVLASQSRSEHDMKHTWRHGGEAKRPRGPAILNKLAGSGASKPRDAKIWIAYDSLVDCQASHAEPGGKEIPLALLPPPGPSAVLQEGVKLHRIAPRAPKLHIMAGPITFGDNLGVI